MLFLPPSLAFFSREPLMQTLSGRLLTYILSSRIGNAVSIDAIQISVRNGIIMEGVVFKDHHDSTMLNIDELIAKPVYADWGLFGIRFSKIELNGVEFRLAKYKEDNDLNLNLVINKFRSDTIESKNAGSFKLKSKKLFIRDALFQYYDEHREYEIKSDMDYSNMIFDSIYIDATNFVLINDSLNFKINTLNTNEASGIRIRNMRSDFSISNTGLKADNLEFAMNNSRLELDFGFNYNSYKSYGYFIDSVMIYADIRPSEMLMSDIGFFNDVMKSMSNRVGISGKVYGTIANINGDDVRVHYGTNTRLALNGQIIGLPDIYTSYVSADFNEISTTTCELKSLKVPFDNKYLDFTDYIDCKEIIKLDGQFRGYFNDFNANFGLQTPEGDIKAEVQYTDIPNDTVHFDLNTQGDTVNIGKWLKKSDILGNANYDIKLKGHGNNWSDLKLKSSGTLRSLDLLDYNYSRIRYSGRYYKGRAEGNIIVGDQNLMLNTDVVVDIKSTPEIAIVADIRKANLEKLQLWRGYNFRFSTLAVAKFKGLDPDSMTGRILLEKTILAFGKDTYSLEKTILDKKLNDIGIHSLVLESDIADLNLSGQYKLTTFGDRFIELINHYLNAIPQEEKIQYPESEYADLQFTLHNNDLITKHFIPGLNLSDNLSVDASLNFNKYLLDVSTKFDYMQFKGIEMKDNVLEIYTRDDYLMLEYANKNTIFRDSTSDDKTVFGLDNFKLKALAVNDSLAYGINWNNADSVLMNSGDLSGYYRKTNNQDYFKITNSNVVVNDTAWTIEPSNMVIFDTLGTWFHNVNIYGGTSRLDLAGKFPRHDGDSLTASFNKWNLSIFDMITRLWNFELDGIINGTFQYGLVNNNPVISSDLVINDLAMNKEYLGTAELYNTWNNSNESIILKSKVFREGSSGTAEVVSINGLYFPFKNDESFDFNLGFDHIKIKAFEPFFAEFISQLEGVAAGELKLKGSAEKPVLTGYVDMHRTQLLVNYLNTKYSFSNKIIFKEDKISFDELVIYDTLGNYANVDGSLKHKYFQNTAFDVNVTTDKLLAFNTTRKMNELYYGTGFIRGNFKVGGTAKDVSLKMNLTSLAGTDVKLPLDYSVEISDKDYIIFIDHSDTLTRELDLISDDVEQDEDGKLEWDLQMNLNINPEAKVTIFMPSDMGRIESEGSGKLKLKTNTNGDFSLIGDYTVTDGLFHFSLANLVSKRFDLVEGGRISWTGDPYEANLSLKGLYKVKTNLSSLGVTIDSSASYKNKVNVDCYVVLKNQLLNPDISFEILMPDLNPDLQRMVYSELDTTNQAMMNEQMISLLVLGTFSFSNSSNIRLGAAAYYSVLTNQLSSMLSKISDDFDVGVNYKPGDNVSQEEFEVALSTQLFDDRLLIDGNFGMTYDRTGQNVSNIVGDVDVGYKITEDGRWILKAFNHSNVNSWYNYANYDKVSPYTQGVGVAFRKEFTHISELFKRTKPKKPKKENENNKESTRKD